MEQLSITELTKQLYPPGTKFKNMIINTIHTVPINAYYFFHNTDHTTYVYIHINMMNITLFKDNKWAEIINDIDDIQIVEF